jgi:hypothetical protein
MAQVAIHPPSGLRLHQMLEAESFLASRCKAGHGSSVTVDDHSPSRSVPVSTSNNQIMKP